jgi:ABC-type taurine transport system substrate-binding protein
MLNFLRNRNLRTGVLGVIFLIAFLLSGHAIALEKNLGKGIHRSGTVTIVGKTADSIIVKERHFRLIRSTTLWGVDQKKIQIYNLPIPCEAEIRYLLRMDQDPLLLEAQLTNILPGASASWELLVQER